MLKHTPKPPDMREALFNSIDPGDIIGSRIIKYLVIEKSHIPFSATVPEAQAASTGMPLTHVIRGMYCLYGTELHLLGSKEPFMILQRGYTLEAEARLPIGWLVWKSPERAA